jgi:ABC-type multidrug transport system fused ATPase/permease subunit
MHKGLHEKILAFTVIRVFKLLPLQDRPKVVAVVLLQVGLGFLDLIGVAGIGILGALTVSGIQSQEPGEGITSFLEIIGLSEMTFQSQVAILGISAASILIFRTVLSVFFIKEIFYFLSRRGALISSELASKLFSQSILQIQARSNQETLFALTSGINFMMLGVLGSAITIIADVSLLLIMGFSLFIVDTTIAISSLLFFGVLGLILYKSMNVKAFNLGILNSKLAIESNEKIAEALNSYRESVARNRISYYINEISRLRLKAADTAAEIQFMPNVSKYVIESGIVVGALFIAGVQFALQDARHAIATLSIFLASGTRIAPAVMRLQQSAIQIKSAVGMSTNTLSLIEVMKEVTPGDLAEVELETSHIGFSPVVVMESVYLRYPNQEKYSLKDVSLKVRSGETLAIVGPSGAGKTSLVDAILGILDVDSGKITIGGINPKDSVIRWPGAISYVPQDVFFSGGTFRDNVALGFPSKDASDELVWAALEVAQLSEHVRGLPLGIDTLVGHGGTMMSGGQRQRLGIARAMFTQPKLLILDEATSSLDGQTEADISDALRALKGVVTVVMVAHRLSTVRNADQVIYMEKGGILSRGTFEEVRRAVPDFDSQAKLMGL